jgi:hypothetical protein
LSCGLKNWQENTYEKGVKSQVFEGENGEE